MRIRLGMLGLSGLLAAAVVSGVAGAASRGWVAAIEVPGTASLNGGAYAQVTSVSCKGAACAAGGFYETGSGHVMPFVVGEKRGVWGDAIEVPGIATLNQNGDAEVTSLSCGAAGACAAGGFYTNASDQYDAFVVDERRGRWGDAVEVPGMTSLNHGPQAQVNSVSCAAPGECVAGGIYSGRYHHTQPFVVTETRGRWGQAIRVPGVAGPNRSSYDARVNAVSCGAVGDCVAGGHWTDSSGDYRPFVATMTQGSWGRAAEVSPTAPLSLVNAEVTTVSCAGAGACVAGGDASTSGEGFVTRETHGRWGPALAVSGRELLPGSRPQVTSLSCAAAGECVAGGMFTDDLSQQAFLVNVKHGRWGHAFEVPGIVNLNTAGAAQVTSVSCAVPGECVAGGRYQDEYGHFQAFLAVQDHGHWRNAVQVPGTPALNRGDAQVNSVSCSPASGCAAGGSYQDAGSGYQAFVVTRR